MKKRITRYVLVSLIIIIVGLFYFHEYVPATCPTQPDTVTFLDNVEAHYFNGQAYRLQFALEAQDTVAIRAIVAHLIASRNVNNDSLIGYGLNYEFDVFQDGSVNPVGHEYTYTNGRVLGELARALQLDIWSAEEYDAIRSTIYQVVQAVNDTAWDESGYYRYSHAPTDIDHVLNVNAIWIGTQQYILANTDIGTQAERQLWQERNTQGIMNLLYIMPRNPLTVYRTGHPILNDLDHQAAQLRYLEVYRDNGGWLPYGAQDAIDSLYAYQHGESWYVRPDYNQCLVNTWHVDYTLQILTR